MRPLGLRLQLLLLLGGLLVATFLPLQWALSTYTQVTLHALEEEHADGMLGAQVALAEACPHLDCLQTTLSAEARSGRLAAAVIRSPHGHISLGHEALAQTLAQRAEAGSRHGLRVRGKRARVTTIDSPAKATLAVWASPAAERSSALLQSFALYASLIGFSLLLLLYFGLTRLIVRPLDALSRSAESVTLGSRALDVPTTSTRELVDLGRSLQRMTYRLTRDEESLRNKVAEVERATTELSQAQAQLFHSERLASVGRLSAGLAHEIGNPLAALTGLQDLLLEGELSEEERRDFLQRMKAETERIHRTLQDLLQFARRSSTSPGPPSAPGQVETAIADTVALVLHHQSMKRVQLNTDVEPNLAPVRMSNEQLTQVLLNLLLNAGDALEGREDGVVQVRAKSRDGEVAVIVEDNGPGVPGEVAEHIFDPFFTTKEVGKGTGLGLSVCQGLVEAAGGHLDLCSTPEAGACFRLRLPTLTTQSS